MGCTLIDIALYGKMLLFLSGAAFFREVIENVKLKIKQKLMIKRLNDGGEH